MRDQLNGQLYDAWRTDCDVKISEVGHMSASVRIPRLDDKYYSHSAIPPEVGQFMVHDNVRYSCGLGECRGACDVCHDDDYAHNIVPARKDAVYDSYEDKLTE